MAIRYAMPKALAELLDNARSELENFIEEQRSERDDKSDRWQESDKAQAHEAWLDELECLQDSLQNLPECES